MSSEKERIERALKKLHEIRDVELSVTSSAQQVARLGAWTGPTQQLVDDVFGQEEGDSFETLSGAKGVYIRHKLDALIDRMEHLQQLLDDRGEDPVIADDLANHAAQIVDPQVRAFVEEAVGCYKARHYRSAVVLSWVGAVAVLQDWVVAHRLAEVNAEALRRNARWQAAATREQLGEMKESVLLQILDTIGAISKNEKQELERCLTLRNGSGHPTAVVVGPRQAAAHLESLVHHVFAKFA